MNQPEQTIIKPNAKSRRMPWRTMVLFSCAVLVSLSVWRFQSNLHTAVRDHYIGIILLLWSCFFSYLFARKHQSFIAAIIPTLALGGYILYAIQYGPDYVDGQEEQVAVEMLDAFGCVVEYNYEEPTTTLTRSIVAEKLAKVRRHNFDRSRSPHKGDLEDLRAAIVRLHDTIEKRTPNHDTKSHEKHQLGAWFNEGYTRWKHQRENVLLVDEKAAKVLVDFDINELRAEKYSTMAGKSVFNTLYELVWQRYLWRVWNVFSMDEPKEEHRLFAIYLAVAYDLINHKNIESGSDRPVLAQATLLYFGDKAKPRGFDALHDATLELSRARTRNDKDVYILINRVREQQNSLLHLYEIEEKHMRQRRLGTFPNETRPPLTALLKTWYKPR